MALFDPPSVKDLKKKAEFIGGMYGMAFRGPPYSIKWEYVAEVVDSPSQRADFRGAFDAAAADVGPDKALTKATRAAKNQADAIARLAGRPYGDVLREAENAVRTMLGC